MRQILLRVSENETVLAETEFDDLFLQDAVDNIFADTEEVTVDNNVILDKLQKLNYIKVLHAGPSLVDILY
jgi:hypothetical protein